MGLELNNMATPTGGYIIPDVLTRHRKGVMAKIARLFNHSYGWVEFNLRDELLLQSRASFDRFRDTSPSFVKGNGHNAT